MNIDPNRSWKTSSANYAALKSVVDSFYREGATVRHSQIRIRVVVCIAALAAFVASVAVAESPVPPRPLMGAEVRGLKAVPLPLAVREGSVAVQSADAASAKVLSTWGGQRATSAEQLLERLDAYWASVNSARVWSREHFNRISLERPNRFAFERSEYWRESPAAYCNGPTLFIESTGMRQLLAGDTGGTLVPLLENPYRLMQNGSFMPLTDSALFPLRFVAGKPSELMIPRAIRPELVGVEKLESVHVHRLRFHYQSSHRDVLIAADGPPVPLAFTTSTDRLHLLSHWEINVTLPEATFTGSPPAWLTRRDLDLIEVGRDLIGQLAPDCVLERLDGTRVTLSELRGKQAIVLGFWSMTCGPCMRELAHFPDVAEVLGSDVLFLAVNPDDKRDRVERFIQDKIWKPFVVCDAGAQAADLFDRWALPHLVVIDRQGVVRKVYVGVAPDLKGMIDDALGKPQP